MYLRIFPYYIYACVGSLFACIWTGKRICFSLRSVIHYVLSVLHVNLWCREKTKTDLMGLFNSRYIYNKQITA